ncbi:probable serine/threonine-protein kinase DDB_G0278845 [Phymastichus coffea]|uniref:probable serine/threonine-protein kinase DDB_G0278845 n=1 Tax=Phymastichus coffea TaxID=108790 RepID=UPI00273A9E82|nr:probable serine/threonine-protein kinase DDB_G0278845 [Phymastichus coffea]
MLHFNVEPRYYHPPLLPPTQPAQQQPLFLMRYVHSDDNYNDYNLPPPPLAFRYDTPSYTTRSTTYSFTDQSYDSMNSVNSSNISNNNSNNNNEMTSLMGSVFDENDYDDVVEEDSPKKGLLKQMFCLPLN